MKKCRYYLPRVLSLLYICFISLFSLDAWGESGTFWSRLLGWIIHMIPSLLLLCITYIAHKRPKVGGIAFLLIAIVFTFFFNTYRMMISFVLISGIVASIGVLYLISTVSSSGGSEDVL